MTENSRRRGKTVYERIEDTKNKIASAEERVKQLKQELDELYTMLFEETAKQQEIEMKRLFDLIGKKHMPLGEVVKLLEEQ